MQVTCQCKFWIALISNHIYSTDVMLLEKWEKEVGVRNEIALNTTGGEEGEL